MNQRLSTDNPLVEHTESERMARMHGILDKAMATAKEIATELGIDIDTDSQRLSKIGQSAGKHGDIPED